MDINKNEKPAPRQPVKYITAEKSLIGNDVVEAGVEVMYAGLPAENLIPTCDEGRARAEEYKESNAERVRTMRAQFSESAVGDPSAFMADFARAQAQDAAEQRERFEQAQARYEQALADQQARHDHVLSAMPEMIAGAVAQALAMAFPNGTAKPAAKPAEAKQADDPLV